MQYDLKHNHLSSHHFFSQISSERIHELAAKASVKQVAKGEHIFFSHEPVKRIYFLQQGMIKIIGLDTEGNEMLKDIIQRDDVFGEFVHFPKQEANLATYGEVISDNATMYSFTLEDFEQILEKNHAVSLKFIQKVVNNLKKFEGRYIDLISKDVRTRVVRFIKKIVQDNGKHQGKSVAMRNYLTHKDIAQLIGSTRQTVTSVLNELKHENKLIYSRHEIVIPNIDLL